MGTGALAGWLTLPLTSVLLATLLLASDGLAIMPLVIVAHVTAARIAPRRHAADGTRTCGQRHSRGQCRAGVNSASDTPAQLRARSVPGTRTVEHSQYSGRPDTAQDGRHRATAGQAESICLYR